MGLKVSLLALAILFMQPSVVGAGTALNPQEAQAAIPRLWERMLPYFQNAKFGPNLNWEEAAEEVATIARALPEFDSLEFRNVAISTLRGARRYMPDAEPRIVALYQASPNAMVREAAASGAEIALARKVPMTMAFTAVDGRHVDLSQMRGKIVLIDFWAATWCGACKVQLPMLKEVYAKYHDMGFEVVGIACEMKESDRDAVLAYVKANEIPWPQFFDGKGMGNEYTRRYGFIGIPQYFLLDRNGLLLDHTHSSTGLSNLEAVVRKHLELPPLNPGDERKLLGVRD
jgi:thiol-disulfide isomerase/thioredoxin